MEQLSFSAYDAGDGTGGTLSTAASRPAEGTVDYVWPGARRTQSFAPFTPGEWSVPL